MTGGGDNRPSLRTSIRTEKNRGICDRANADGRTPEIHGSRGGRRGVLNVHFLLLSSELLLSGCRPKEGEAS